MSDDDPAGRDLRGYTRQAARNKFIGEAVETVASHAFCIEALGDRIMVRSGSTTVTVPYPIKFNSFACQKNDKCRLCFTFFSAGRRTMAACAHQHSLPPSFATARIGGFMGVGAPERLSITAMIVSTAQEVPTCSRLCDMRGGRRPRHSSRIPARPQSRTPASRSSLAVRRRTARLPLLRHHREPRSRG